MTRTVIATRTRQTSRTRRAAWAVATLALLATGLTPSSAAAMTPDCTSPTPGAPVWVTADCTDPGYASPVIDNQTDETVPVVHHRVSGHFEGTNIQFNVYLPPARLWKGRFFQYTYPTAFAPEQDTSKATDQAIGFAVASGGYAVQAGNASVSVGYRHDAAAAKFAEQFAARYYHAGNRQIYGYLYGPSGGSFQTTGAAENTTGVWEGFVPMVQGVPMSVPYTFFIRALARLVLQDKAEQIATAVRPGGSGDPYAGLDQAQQAMLHELTAFGVPLQAWENPDYLLGLSASDGLLGFGSIVRSIDPTYAVDFWSKPGYLGTEQSPLGDVVRAALAKSGDTPDNRWDIALRAYYRYQLPPTDDGYVSFAQFRNPDGSAMYPQRPILVGPLVGSNPASGGATFNGAITGKMIVVDNLYDVDALPIHADWYASRVRSSLGEQRFRNSYRLYYNDHADHLEGPVTGFRSTYLINYYGIVEQALRDLSAWVERQTPPPASTRYTQHDAQLAVPGQAPRRRGLQPTVDLTAKGRTSVDVTAGQTVTFDALIQTPPDGGRVVGTAWDFTGTGTYTAIPVRRPASTLRVRQTHRFDTPGTYYVALSVTAQRDATSSAFANLDNIDRIRVVVHAPS
ncbi:MAG: PKD domain-containing protein [Jiangellaceae bacterium]